MYSEAFCKVYNEFGWNYYPEAFGEELMHWMQVNAVSVSKSVDLACGTGVLCEYLRERGIETAGMDFSAEMIAIAEERCREIPYEVADMITWIPEEKYDLVTCTGDALNHIRSLTDVAHIFRNVYEYLNDGGYFIFDLLNPNEVALDDPIEMDWSETVRCVFCMTQDEDGTIHLRIRVTENGEIQFEEDIQEVIHDTYAITELLKRSGFKVIRLDHQLTDDQPGKGLTWFVVAQKFRS